MRRIIAHTKRVDIPISAYSFRNTCFNLDLYIDLVAKKRLSRLSVLEVGS
jgi:hypothetical protein